MSIAIEQIQSANTNIRTEYKKEMDMESGSKRLTIDENSKKQNEKEDETFEMTEKQKEKEIIEAIEKASGKIERENKGLEFSIHEGTNQIMIKVIDENTGEVLKEVPPEKILDIIAKMVEIAGNFIDERR